MVKQIRPAKYVAETIPYIVDFSDMLMPGESITGTPTVSIYLADGSDLNPSAMLFGGVTITGNVVTQNIRQGIAGDIYSIVFSISTSLSHTYEKDFYLAILPVSGSAVPNWQPVWLTTFPYPTYYFESMVAAPAVAWGSSLYNPFWTESLAPAILGVVYGNLYGGAVTYSNPHENLSATPAITWSNLYGGIQTYLFVESLDTNVAIIEANLYGGAITYNNPHEDLTATPSILTGTLS